MKLSWSRSLYFYLVPIVLFVGLLVMLNQLSFINLGTEALLAILSLYMFTQVYSFLSSYVRARRAQEHRVALHRAIVRLSTILRMPKLLADAPRDRERSPEEISTDMFFENLRFWSIDDLPIFVHFVLSGRTFGHSMDDGPQQPFLEEIVAYYRQRPTATTVLWSSQSILGTVISRNPKAEPVLEVEEPLSRLGEYERALSSHDPGRQFCLVFPLTFEEHSNTPSEKLSRIAYVGILSDSFISAPLAGTLAALVDQYQSLYGRIRAEQLTMLLDDIQNEDMLSGATIRAAQIGRSFRDRFSSVLLRSFEADKVEVWVRGVEPDPSESIFPLVPQMVASSAGPLAVNILSSVGGYRFGLETRFELENCALGFIRLLRDSLPFSPLDANLLHKVAQVTDNYIRDLWAQQVVRTIDEEVLNVASPSLGEFLELLIKTLVQNCDAFAGGVTVFDYASSFYCAPGYGSDPDLDTRIKNSLERLSTEPPTPIKRRNGYHELELTISIGQGERLGAVYLIGDKKLTSLHHKIVKTVESHIDNIIKLYVALQRHRRSVGTDQAEPLEGETRNP